MFLLVSVTNYSFAQFTENPDNLYKDIEGERYRVSSYNVMGINQDNYLVPPGQKQVLLNIT